MLKKFKNERIADGGGGKEKGSDCYPEPRRLIVVQKGGKEGKKITRRLTTTRPTHRGGKGGLFRH